LPAADRSIEAARADGEGDDRLVMGVLVGVFPDFGGRCLGTTLWCGQRDWGQQAAALVSRSREP